jgi:hypothetical protein
MYVNKEKFKYNYFGPVCCFLGLPIRIKNKYFCSQFVAEILSENNIVKLKKSAALYHPRDLAKLEELTLVYEGKLSELNAENNDLAQTIVIGAEA